MKRLGSKSLSGYFQHSPHPAAASREGGRRLATADQCTAASLTTQFINTEMGTRGRDLPRQTLLLPAPEVPASPEQTRVFWDGHDAAAAELRCCCSPARLLLTWGKPAPSRSARVYSGALITGSRSRTPRRCLQRFSTASTGFKVYS